MKTDWTYEKDVALVKAVDKAMAAGFHKLHGPKRTDNLKVLFWVAVAVLMADGPYSPTPGACGARYTTAVKTIGNMADHLAKFDDLWDSIDVEAEREEQISEEVSDIKRMLKALCTEWGIE